MELKVPKDALRVPGVARRGCASQRLPTHPIIANETEGSGKQ